LVWVAEWWNSLHASRNPKNNWCLSCIYGVQFGEKDWGLSTYPETFILYENMYNEHHLYSKHICISYIFYCFFRSDCGAIKSVLCIDTIFKIVLSNVHIS
jgi:hypothetical protein